MNIVVEVDSLPATNAEPDHNYQGKIGSAELARQVIEDFALAPEVPKKQ
jgi:hypothetical protein